MTAAFDARGWHRQIRGRVYGHDARLDAWLRARTDEGEQ